MYYFSNAVLPVVLHLNDFLWTERWHLGQGGGVIQGTASEAVLVALLAARDKVLRRVGKEFMGKLVVYCSDQTHSAIQKACQVNKCSYAKVPGKSCKIQFCKAHGILRKVNACYFCWS